MSETDAAELSHQIAALPGIQALYPTAGPVPLLADIAKSLLAVPATTTAPITISDTTISIRVGIDHTHSIDTISAAIHHTITTYRAEYPRTPAARIDIEIATIR